MHLFFLCVYRSPFWCTDPISKFTNHLLSLLWMPQPWSDPLSLLKPCLMYGPYFIEHMLRAALGMCIYIDSMIECPTLMILLDGKSQHFWYVFSATLRKSLTQTRLSAQFSSVQSLSCVRLFVTPWTAACQASLSITNCWSLPKPMSIESVSHPLLSPAPPALSLSQYQGLFKWVSSSNHVAKVLEFRLQHQSFQWTPRLSTNV